MKNSTKSAFTLVELLVVIAIIGTLIGLLLPAVQSSREASRALTCSVNLTQIQVGLQLYEESNDEYPGYVEALGYDEDSSKGVSWPVMILPFIEQSALWDSWNNASNTAGRRARVAVLLCPSNPPDTENSPSLSYVVNAGNIENEPEDMCDQRMEQSGNGVFFDRWRFPHHGNNSPNVDQRDGGEGCCLCPTTSQSCECADPRIMMTLAHVQTGDGATSTMMVSESLRTVGWADGKPDRPDRKWHFGFCWAQPDEVLEGMREKDDRRLARINGRTEPSRYNTIDEMGPHDAFLSSHHPGIVNVAFVAGNVKPVSEKISPLVYAQLMTSNRKTSELVKYTKDGTVSDDELAQPSDDQY